ncbi:MAG: hypothetical protein M3457_01370 [Chloroflexota bacterium]|nr:hypothetical protein [Chloroflexota bacterium]
MPSGTTWFDRLGPIVTHTGATAAWTLAVAPVTTLPGSRWSVPGTRAGLGVVQGWAAGLTVEWADMTWLKGRDGGATPPSRQ